VTALSSVAVVGLGYIGLPTAVSLATGGLEVIGVDVNPDIVEQVNSGPVSLHPLVYNTTSLGTCREPLCRKPPSMPTRSRRAMGSSAIDRCEPQSYSRSATRSASGRSVASLEPMLTAPERSWARSGAPTVLAESDTH
jgi:hypothetical protein